MPWLEEDQKGLPNLNFQPPNCELNKPLFCINYAPSGILLYQHKTDILSFKVQKILVLTKTNLSVFFVTCVLLTFKEETKGKR